MKENLRPKFEKLNDALDWFVQELKNTNDPITGVPLWDTTTIVVTSDFARTLTAK